MLKLLALALFGAVLTFPVLAQSPPVYELDGGAQSVIRLSNLVPATCVRSAISGNVVKREFDSSGLVPSGFVLEDSSGSRRFINVDTTTLNSPQVNMVVRGWVVTGLQTLIREGQSVQGSVQLCGAAGRFAYLEEIALERQITPSKVTRALGPSFDCTAKPVATQPLAQMICQDRELAITELGYVIAYQALREASSPIDRKAMVDTANALVTEIGDNCNLPKTGALQRPPTDGQVACIKRRFVEQRSILIALTTGPAHDEAILQPADTVAIQAALQAKSYLPPSADVDGVFGPVTRQAIAKWQNDSGLTETGFGSKAMLTALTGAPLPGASSVVSPSPSVQAAATASPAPQVDSTGKTSSIRLALGDGPDLRAQDLFEQVSTAVFVVRTQQALGSAVAISERELLTNCHVVKSSTSITIEHEDRKYAVQLRSANFDADRCILTISDVEQPLVKWVRVRPYSDVKVGESVFTIGAPRGLELSLAEGLVSSKRVVDEGRLIQTSAPISPGSSGGGLFDAHGHLIGITTFMLKDAQNLNFAIAAEEYAK